MTEPLKATLTRAERFVVDELLRDGPSNAVIAERLGVCEDTVKTHVRRILAKTGSSTRTQVAVRVFRDQVILMAPARQQVPA